MEFRITELGNLRAAADADKKAWTKANWQAVKAVGEEFRDALRADVKESGIRRANALSKTIRGQVFPRNPARMAQRPAYVIGHKTEYLRTIFQTGGTIRAKKSVLLVPTAQCRRLIKLRPGQPHTAYLEEAVKRFGRLATIKSRKTGEVFLGAFVALEGGRNRPVYLFRLTKSVEMPALLKAEAVAAKFHAGFAVRMDRELLRRFEIERTKLGVTD